MRLSCEFRNRPRVFVTASGTAGTNFLVSHARRTETVPEFLDRFWKRRPRSCCEYILGNKNKSQGVKWSECEGAGNNHVFSSQKFPLLLLVGDQRKHKLRGDPPHVQFVDIFHMRGLTRQQSLEWYFVSVYGFANFNTTVSSVRDMEGRNDSSSLQPLFPPVSTEEALLKHICSPHGIAIELCSGRFMSF
jgi:hypothetical protein